MSEVQKEEAKIEKERSGLSGSLLGELHSRKWRAAIIGTIAVVAEQFAWFDDAWKVIALVAAYIMGVAYEDGKAKSASSEQTNLNVGGTGIKAPVVRTKRTSSSPVMVGGATVGAQVETLETEFKGK